MSANEEGNSIPNEPGFKSENYKPDIEQHKTGGAIRQRQKDMFTIRLKAPGGRLSLSKIRKIVEVAEKYSKSDYVHLSVRQSVEIPYVDYRNIDSIQTELGEVDQAFASCGSRVRVPTACSGCEYNPNGLVDTQAMAKLSHDRFFGETTPHKFKMNFSGCPIDCARTSEADLGFQGAIYPKWDEDKCVGCTICEKACKECAIKCDGDGKPVFDSEKCVSCSDCIRNCPAEAWFGHRKGLIVRVGGKHGRHPLNASIVAMFMPEERLEETIKQTIEWYRSNSVAGERKRFGDLLRETGMESYMRFMREVFGEYAVANPRVPEPIVIHMKGSEIL